jgi:hypothetical protein
LYPDSFIDALLLQPEELGLVRGFFDHEWSHKMMADGSFKETLLH